MVPDVTVHTAPASEPVTATEAKAQCLLDSGVTEHDTWFTGAIKAARLLVEARTNRGLVTQTLEYWADRFPSGVDRLYLPRAAPLASVTHVKYYDTDGTLQTWTSTNYTAITTHEPGYIVAAYQVNWPTTRAVPNAVQIRYVVGVADSSVDTLAKQAILMLIAHWFANREAVMVGTISKEVEFSFTNLCDALSYGDEFVCYGRAD